MLLYSCKAGVYARSRLKITETGDERPLPVLWVVRGLLALGLLCFFAEPMSYRLNRRLISRKAYNQINQNAHIYRAVKNRQEASLVYSTF